MIITMGFWNRIRGIFRKEEQETLQDNLEYDELEYTGYEPDCWACAMPIHKTHEQRKLHGNIMHGFCFKRIKSISLNGGSEDVFHQ